MKKSAKAALCGVFTALSAVLLFLGGVTYIFAYTMPVVAGLLMIALKKTFGISSAVIVYISTGILSMFLVPDKECTLMYVFFFGYYPLLQSEINKINPFILKWLAKLVLFNMMLTACQLVLVYVFGIPFIEEGEGKYFIILFYILMNLLLVVYDILISKIRTIYELKLEKLLKKYLK